MPPCNSQGIPASQEAPRRQYPGPPTYAASQGQGPPWALVNAGIVVFVCIWAYLGSLNAPDCCHPEWGDPDGVTVTVHSPGNLAVGEPGELRVTAVNHGGSAARVTVAAQYTGTLPCLSEDGQGHAMHFGSLLANERATERVTMQLPLCWNRDSSSQSWLGSSLEAHLEFELIVDDGSPETLGTLSLPVMPVPYARTFGTLARTVLVGLGVWALKERWDQLRKAGQSTVVHSAGTGP